MFQVHLEKIISKNIVVTGNQKHFKFVYNCPSYHSNINLFYCQQSMTSLHDHYPP